MTDHAMNEYEGALFDAIAVLSKAVAEGVFDRGAIASRYREVAQWEKDAGRKNGEATLELLARLTEADRMYKARPSFTVIDGGKSDDPSN
jgi:hypothetical protein